MISLMYHDIIPEDAKKNDSGFNIKGADAYKISESAFEQQVAFAAKVRDEKGSEIIFTFDDGGKSALETTAPILEKHYFKGIFFIPTAFTGQPGFLTSDDILKLHNQGHTIGSHSHTHPYQMNKMSYQAIVKEWKESVSVLQDIIKSPVIHASVPGGWYSLKVAHAAQEAGIKNLYTSKPGQFIKNEGNLKVFGRYSIQENNTFYTFKNIVDHRNFVREKKLIMWKLKQVVKLFY